MNGTPWTRAATPFRQYHTGVHNDTTTDGYRNREIWWYNLRTEEHRDQVYPQNANGRCGDDGFVWFWGYDGSTPGPTMYVPTNKRHERWAWSTQSTRRPLAATV